MTPRKYNLSAKAKKARKRNAKLPRPARTAGATQWKKIRFPLEMWERYKKKGEAFHITIKNQLEKTESPRE